MKHRIRRIGILKAAMIGGIAYAIMTLLLVPFFLLLMLMPGAFDEMGRTSGDWMMAPALLLLAPLVYGAMGFIGTGLAAAVYNLIATMVGGLEVELEPLAGPSPDPARITSDA